MVRNKKKMTHSDFEEYVVSWWVGQVELEQEMVEELEQDRCLCEQERSFIFSAIADRLEALLELLEPCTHDEVQLVEWAREFISQWQVEDFDREN